ncbi:hypothetical protein DVH26_28005 [Paenibacillus sp. H1-7]|uniref:hypothetical protein n=1 Tax=Paenibacillus sp. H1-7 TaxID=2282849 RepID=UPI001EF7B4C7|nr:hypothetical protein [Paenibacillus sp. H1-7]ULL17971.1 hypothetical protein DVH26_28005 [Paenibacillus sp. H1-7]
MKKTKLLSKKAISGSVAAALLLGGFACAPGTNAFAAEAAPVSPVVAKYLNNLIPYAAGVSAKDEEHVRYELSVGQNLEEATGLSSSELTEKLVNNFNAYIDYTQSGASAEEIQKLKNEGAQQISEALQNGYHPVEDVATVDFNAVIQQRLKSIVSDVAAVSDEDFENIESQLQAGASLVRASGMPQMVLFDALNSLMSQSIDNAVGQLTVDPEKVQQAKQEAAEKISEAITIGGGPVSEQASTSSFAGVIKLHLASLISDASNIADKDYSEVLLQVKDGATIPQAVGMSQSELAADLILLMNQAIDSAGSSDSAAVEQAKADAAKQIEAALSTGGYSASKPAEAADISAQVQDRLKLVVSDAATIADQELADVQDLVNSGASLAGATGLSGDYLVSALTAVIDPYINSLTNDADAQAKAKADAAEQIRTWVYEGYGTAN